MTASESEFDPVGIIAEEFFARLRRGENPSIIEYTDRFPEYAQRIRSVISALEVVEKLKPGSNPPGALTGVPTTRPRRGDQMPDVIGDYRILREIGRGGMGVVYEAEQQSLHRHVAVKLLPAGVVQNRKARERFRREASTAGKLHHTNIVPVYEVGEADGSLFYAMQFIHGHGLDQILSERIQRQTNQTSPRAGSETSEEASFRNPPSASVVRSSTDEVPALSSLAPPNRLSGDARLEGLDAVTEADGPAYWQAVARIGVQVADALNYAHHRQVLHRDIKPSNLILDSAGTVWITDFGLAKPAANEDETADALTETGDIVGTIRYMAPERIRGLGDARSDTYGLGITLYEMLTLRPAFGATDRLELIQQVARDEPPRPRSIDRRIPRDFETIVGKACHKEPDRRYQTAGDLAQDLLRFLEMRPILARETSTAERAWWWCRRNPAMAGSLFAVAALLLFIAVGATATAFYLNATLEQSETHRRSAENAGEMAASETRRAEAAERERTEQLWSSLRNQANALVLSGRPGQRHQGLEAIRQASAIRQSLELRNAAITCMTLPDLETDDITWAATSESLDFGRQALVAGTNGLEVDKPLPGIVTVAECVTGKEVGRITGCLTPNEVWFSSDSTYLVLQAAPVAKGSTDAPVEVWDWRLKKRIVEFVGDPRFGLAFRPDHTQCVLGNASGELVFFNLPEGTEHHRAQMVISTKGYARSCVYSPDGAQVVTFLPYTLTVQFLDSRSTEFADTRKRQGVVRSFVTPAELIQIAVSADGRFLAAACTNWRANVWDLETGQRIREFVGHQAYVAWVCFVPNESALVTWSYDRSLRYWDLATGQSLLRHQVGPRPKFDSDSCRWVSDHNSVLHVQRLTTSREFRTLLGHTSEKGPTHVAFHPQGRMLATSSLDGVRLWDADAGTQLGVLPGRFVSSHFTPDGRNFLACGAVGVFCWPVETDAAAQTMRFGPAIQLAGESSERRSSLTPDGAWLAATDLTHNTAELFEVSTLKKSFAFSGIVQIAFALLSPDGRWCVGGTWPGHHLAIWDARSGELVERIEIDGPPNASFNPSGTRLVVNGRNQGRVYSVPGWNVEAELPRHSAGGFGVPCHSPDGRILAMTRNGYLIQLLDSTTYEELATLESTQPLLTGQIDFSPDGTRLAANCGANAAMLWDLRLVRKRLAEMNLDWALPEYPPAPYGHEKCPQIVIDHSADPRPIATNTSKTD